MLEKKERLSAKQDVQGVLFLLLIVLALGIAGNIETHYNRKDCVVVEVKEDLVTVEDSYGHLWEYYAETPIEVGTKVDLRIYTNCTDETNTDDEIVKVRVH